MKLHLMEDRNVGIFAIVRDDNGKYLCDADIKRVDVIKHNASPTTDYCEVTAAAIIDGKTVELDGKFYF